AFTCTGNVTDNRIDTPISVRFNVNGVDTVVAAVTQATGNFTGTLVLRKGLNTVAVTATDSAGNSSGDTITVTYADAVATVVAGTTPVTAALSDSGSSYYAVNMGANDSATIIVTNVARTDTLTAVIDFKLTGYTVTVERLDSATLTAALGAAGNLNGITSTNYALLDTFIVKFTATDSQGNVVAENSSAPYDGITLTWSYGPNLPAADEAALHVFYFDPTDSKWKQATTVTGLCVAWPDGSTGEKQSLPNDTIAIRVAHLSIWGIFSGGAPVAGNLDNVVIFPNPFKPYDGIANNGEPYDGNPNGMTGIRFVNLAANTEIKIYTVNGELVDDVQMQANQGLAIWDARNKGGDEVASGVYLVVFKANGQVVVKKLAIIR
ncbi:MAG TPA: T9SS type A sorting domain-containing protein, partial [bacterium]|nr:T9SS type A sorting domain-containing protein [bacterium]